MLSSYAAVETPPFIFPPPAEGNVFFPGSGSYSSLPITSNTLFPQGRSSSIFLFFACFHSKIFWSIITDQNSSSEPKLSNWKRGRDTVTDARCKHGRLRGAWPRLLGARGGPDAGPGRGGGLRGYPARPEGLHSHLLLRLSQGHFRSNGIPKAALSWAALHSMYLSCHRRECARGRSSWVMVFGNSVGRALRFG